MSAPIRQPRPSRAARIKKRDVERLISAALAAAGDRAAKAEVEVDGIIIRVVLATEAGAVAQSDQNEWDD
jgi:hypothetical protein